MEINPGWLELPLVTTNFDGPKHAIEVLIVFNEKKLTLWLFTDISFTLSTSLNCPGLNVRYGVGYDRTGII